MGGREVKGFNWENIEWFKVRDIRRVFFYLIKNKVSWEIVKIVVEDRFKIWIMKFLIF